MENGVMGFLFLGDVWRIFMRLFLGRGGLIALRREGGRKGAAVCIYVSYLYLVFCRDVGIGETIVPLWL